jgi:glyceraldehyde 3-phosphate dehydrogenase
VTVRVGINGFGRIGRNFYRAVQAGGHDIEIVAANDLGDVATMAHLLKYDTTLGTLSSEIRSGEGSITVDGKEIKVLSQRDPASFQLVDRLGLQLIVTTVNYTHDE